MVVAVGLVVGGDVDELRVRAPLGERAEEAVGEVLAAGQEALEGDGARDRTVVEEDRHRPSRRQRAAVRHRRIDRAGVLAPVVVADAPPARGLVRLEDREGDSLLGQGLERVDVDGGLRQPHPLGPAAEAPLEVARAPAHLRPLVALVGERQDHVVVGLRERGAVAAEAVAADAVGVDDGGVDVGLALLEPRQQGRPEVEADGGVVVDDLGDAVARVVDADETDAHEVFSS